MVVGTLMFLLYLVRFAPFLGQTDQFLNVFSTSALITLYFFSLVFALLPVKYNKSRAVLGYVFIGQVTLLSIVLDRSHTLSR